MQQIAFAYLAICKEAKEKTPRWNVAQLAEICAQFINVGVRSQPSMNICSEGIGMLAEFCLLLDKETVAGIFAGILGKVKEVYQAKPDSNMLQRYVFYVLKEYVVKTGDLAVANDAFWLQQSTQLLDSLRDDGSEDALGAYDNICSFLSASGIAAGQQSEFWRALIHYQAAMESDHVEIAYILKFYCTNIGAPGLAENRELVVRLICKLFFGRFYSDINHEKDKAATVAAVSEVIRQNPQLVQDFMQTQADDYNRKNFGYWAASGK